MSFAEDKAEILKKADEELKNFFRNKKLLEDYLNLESIRADNFEGFSVRDMVAVACQNPQVTQLNTLLEWNDAGKRIKKGEKGIVLPDFEPYAPDTNNTKRNLYLFDVTQTQDYNPKSQKKAIEPTKEPSREDLKALLANNQTRLATTDNPERTHGKKVYYDSERNVIIALKGISPLELYQELAVELAHAEMSMNYSDYTRESYDTLAQMSGHIVCKQNKVLPNDISISQELKELTSDEAQAKLQLVRETTHCLQIEIDFYKSNGKERQERYVSPQINEAKIQVVPENEINIENQQSNVLDVSKVSEIEDNAEIPNVQQEGKAGIVHLSAYGENFNIKLDDGVTSDKVLNILANSKYPNLDLKSIGTEIKDNGIVAEFEQSEDCTFTINANEREAHLFVINNGKGGITEENRTDENTKYDFYELYELREKQKEDFQPPAETVEQDVLEEKPSLMTGFESYNQKNGHTHTVTKEQNKDLTTPKGVMK